MVAEPVPRQVPKLVRQLFLASAPKLGLAQATCKSISNRCHGLNPQHGLRRRATSNCLMRHAENRLGIKMTPTVPLQFDGQSRWFEYEDLSDDWLGITTLDADKHGP